MFCERSGSFTWINIDSLLRLFEWRLKVFKEQEFDIIKLKKRWEWIGKGRYRNWEVLTSISDNEW